MAAPAVAPPDAEIWKAKEELRLASRVRPVAPLVSVVISTHNHARWLPDALAAVLDQDLDAEFELVVCDDASDDGTTEILRQAVRGARRPITCLRARWQGGPARGRNLALALARGRFIAFTDSDCVPDRSWLRQAVAAFDREDVGVVQGAVVPAAGRQPLFSHFIVVDHLDGTFATANAVYRREALEGLRFNPALWYMEDVDLGWRVCERGWEAAFAPSAVVRHQVVPIGLRGWLGWPAGHATWPAIATAHPRFREHLFLGIWVRPLHLAFDVALLGAALAVAWTPLALLLCLPYLVALPLARGLRGRFPPLKLALFVVRDAVTTAALALASLRRRSLVL
jgi:GT2 family glycosyltransferase